ncbi:MAG: GNAT family N-acetyltransferase [Candidatus Hodarchaeota archaeon]
MSEILTDTTDSSLKRAIENNCHEIFRLAGTSPNAVFYESPEILFFSHGARHPAYSGVSYANIKPDEIDEKIEEMKRFCESHNIPLNWMIGPMTRPTDLGKDLEAHGFTYVGGATGMAIELRNLKDEHRSPEGLAIKPVSNTEELRHFFDVWTIAHDFPDIVGDACYSLCSDLLFTDNPEACFYVGYKDGEPVATSTIFYCGGVAGLWWVSTIPKARRQGIGTEMTLKPLRIASDMEYRASILWATDMGLPIYRRLGYKEYFKTKNYLHMT